MAKIETWVGNADRYTRLRKIEALDPKKDYRVITKLFYDVPDRPGTRQQQSERNSQVD
jgi:hypothetical protein